MAFPRLRNCAAGVSISESRGLSFQVKLILPFYKQPILQSFNLGIERLIFSSQRTAMGAKCGICFNLGIERLIFSSVRFISHRYPFLWSFNLGIERLIFSSLEPNQDSPGDTLRFNLGIERLIFSRFLSDAYEGQLTSVSISESRGLSFQVHPGQ